jgi:phosphatidylethanolamine-binding protein (PEBP) family uncharacterized protein
LKVVTAPVAEESLSLQTTLVSFQPAGTVSVVVYVPGTTVLLIVWLLPIRPARSPVKVNFCVLSDGTVSFSVNANGSVDFEFQNGNAPSTKFAYTKRPSRPPLPLEQRPEPPMPRRNSPISSATPENPLLKPSSTFVLTSPEVQDGGNLPAEFTGDGAGSTLPLSWTGTPAGTKEFALIMDHAAPDNAIKSYWVAWNIPASKSGIVKNEKDFGKLGFGFRGQVGYEPPHSKGPGPKLYVLTLYALSDFLQPTLSASQTTREVLLEAMKGKVLATASLRVVYTR